MVTAPACAATPAANLVAVRTELFRELLLRFGRARIRVAGTSMLPSLWPGDELEVLAVDVGELRCGDIVMFASGERLFCHRLLNVVRREAEVSLLARGDFLDRADPPVPVSDLLGKVATDSAAALNRRVAACVLRALSRISLRPAAWLVRGRARLRPHSLQ